MSRQAFVLVRHGVVVFWSRKAGNTSLAEWLYDVVVSGKNQRFLRGVAPRKFMLLGQYAVDFRMAYELIRGMGYEDYVLARDPYGRIVSAYVNKFVADRDQLMISFNRLEPFVQKTVAEIAALRPTCCGVGEAYRGLSFEDFLRFIAARIESRGTGEPRLNSHWNTQVPFYFDGRFAYGRILRLERIDRDIAPLALRLGTKLPFPSLRRSAAASPGARFGDLAQVSSVDLARQGIVPNARSLLNPRTRRLIRETYDIDFRLLGYARTRSAPAAKPRAGRGSVGAKAPLKV